MSNERLQGIASMQKYYCIAFLKKISIDTSEGKQNVQPGWLVGWGLTALLTQDRSYRACRFVGIFYRKLMVYLSICIHIHYYHGGVSE